jgi:hypothetical protein
LSHGIEMYCQLRSSFEIHKYFHFHHSYLSYRAESGFLLHN